ncbi:MAG: membrane protein insertion efficiency factor YidD [Nitrospinae bacterium]|nr:membrane protein insertion efficiency factor YidD [Nitrospinota bacterium]MBF0634208.1 membrane protein insertion efficiency factor YidD [Nitrospinota bacterium]
MRRALVLAIKSYKLLFSPFLPPSCIYHPTCSRYAAEAIEKHGAFKGVWFAVKRVLRCNPLSKGGFDAVP